MPLQSTNLALKRLTGSLFGKEDSSDELSSRSSGNATDIYTEDHIRNNSHGVQQGCPTMACPVEQPSDKQHQAPSTTESKPASNKDNNTVPGGKNSFFFARVPPTVTHDQLLELFSKFGKVEDLNLFRPFAEAKTSKGCGIVHYSTAGAAATAKATLHNKYKWSEDASPMVVEWVNEDKMRSTCQKAGSNEIVFEPKSKTKANKQREQQSTVRQQQQPHANRTASSGNVVMQGAMLGDSTLSSDQLLLRQAVYSRQQPLAHGAAYALQQQQHCTSTEQQQPPPPPPPPPPPRAGVFLQGLPRQQQWPLATSAAASAAAVRHVLVNSQQQRRRQQCSGPSNFHSEPLPRVSAAVAAAVTNQDIAQAVLPAEVGMGMSDLEAYVPTFSTQPGALADAAAALQQQQLLGMSGSHQMPLSGNAAMGVPGNCEDSFEPPQLLLMMSSGGSVAGGASVSAAVTDSVSAGLPMTRPLSGAFSLLDTSSFPALQSEYLITSHASNASAAHALSSANAFDATDNTNEGISAMNSAVLLHTAQANFSTSGKQQQPQYTPGSCLAAAAFADGFGGSNAAVHSQGPWHQGCVDASFNASGAGVGSGFSATEHVNLLQRQIVSAGCNMLPGDGCVYAATLSGSCAPGISLQQPQEQAHLCYDDQWLGSGSGYFDMPNSSSNQIAGGGICSGSNIVQGGNCSAAPAGAVAVAAGGATNLALDAQNLQVNNSSNAAAAALQQQLLAGGPSQLRALSDSGMVSLNARTLGHMRVGRAASVTGITTQQQLQLQQQLLQQQLADAVAAAAAFSGSSSSAGPPPCLQVGGSAPATAAPAGASADGFSELFKRQLNLSVSGSGNDTNRITTSTGHQAAAAVAPTASLAAAAMRGALGSTDGMVTVPLAQGTAMVQLLGMHIDSITKLSGAAVQIRAEAGELRVWAKGTPEQTALAQNLVGDTLGDWSGKELCHPTLQQLYQLRQRVAASRLTPCT